MFNASRQVFDMGTLSKCLNIRLNDPIWTTALESAVVVVAHVMC